MIQRIANTEPFTLYRCFHVFLNRTNGTSCAKCLICNSHIHSQNITQLTAGTLLTIACSKLRIETLEKRVKYVQSLQHRCFPVNIAKFLRTPILKNICQRLLLVIPWCHDIYWKTRLQLNNIKKASITHIFHYIISTLKLIKQFSHIYIDVNPLVPDVTYT